MSSIFGHSLIGATLYAGGKKAGAKVSVFWLAIVIFLAVAPDLDYLFYWITSSKSDFRVTHSLMFCLGLGMGIWLLRFCSPSLRASAPPAWVIVAACLTHPLMDLLVAVKPNPWLWPFSDRVYALSFGVLPSAGQLSLPNYYLWRNLLLEFGALMPVSILIYATARKRLRDIPAWGWALLVASIIGFGVLGFMLER